MHALGDFLFPEPAPRTVPGIIAWWERRRLFYNVAVGTTGLITMIPATAIVSVLEGRLVLEPWLGVLAFGVMANVCYCLGPLVEILVAKVWGRTALPVGPAMYRMGLTFSIGLTFVPLLAVFFATFIRIFIDSNFP